MTRDQFDQILEAHGIVIVGDAAWRVAQLAFAAGEQAEREAIMDEWFTRMQADLEHGVKWLSENAAETWRNNYPQMVGFADAVMRRSKE
jgi:hypothetical protein